MQKVSEEVLIGMCFRDAKILIRQETFCLTRNAYLANPGETRYCTTLLRQYFWD